MFYTAARPQRPDYDPAIVWGALLLLALGTVMVYSASITIAEADRHYGHQSTYFLTRHTIYVLLGIGAAVTAFQVPLRVWQRFAPYLFLAGVVLLLLVLVPGIGREKNGSQRWIWLGFTNMQPSELMKFFVVLYAADYTVRKAAFMDSFKKGFLPMLSVMLLTGGLLLREPDFGAFVVIMAIAMAVLFLGGMN